ncbi:MAG: trypsin-like peptidase domain-containing protein [Planctomycetota bacterium]|jgi:serine protease Do
MFRRALVLLALGSLLGVLFATWLGPQPAFGEDPPPELLAEPPRPTARAEDLSRPIIEATRRVRPAIVTIIVYARDRWSGRTFEDSSGSGIIVSAEGHILTNRHVIMPRGRIVGRPVVMLQDERRFENIKVLGADPRSDVAVLKIMDEDKGRLAVAPLGDSDRLEVGELVVAIGSPFKLASSVSLGVVSATGRTGVHRGRGRAEEFIQTDAALNPGNSGGALINLDGQVVGINTAIAAATGANVGIGFSIPINLARSVAVSLIRTGEAKGGWLGIHGFVVDAEALQREGIRANGGFLIAGVREGSPAARAGLKKRMVVTAVDGRAIKDVNILHARLAQAGPNGEVKLTVQTDKGPRTVAVTLSEEPLYTFGIEVATLDRQRARALGLPANARGVVVTRIQQGSEAEQADQGNRLLPGDVIYRIETWGGQAWIETREDFEKVMEVFQARPPSVIGFSILTKEGRFRVTLRPFREKY